MWCYCTPSDHHNCDIITNKIQCPPDIQHCLVGKSGLKITLSCWEWEPTSNCPNITGPCYLLGTNTQRPVCCCKGNLCNDRSVAYVRNPKPVFSKINFLSTSVSTNKSNICIFWIVPSLILLMILFSLILILYFKKSIINFLWHKKYYQTQSKTVSFWTNGISVNKNINENIKENNIKKSIWLNNIFKGNSYAWCNKNKMIAHGRFGQVWIGQINLVKECRTENVAIKIFSDNSEGYKSWKNELLIYSILRDNPHPNILCFHGAEKKKQGLNVELWLVVEYYPLGSLWEYLKNSTVSWVTVLKVCHNIAAGLCHLHSFSNSSHSPIAHRDIKSKNILLKSDFTACIADFGLAICQINYKRSFINRVGTLNYMAPEILEGSINFDIYSFLRIDIFSMSLVFWEILSRCQFPNIIVEDFQTPFQTLLGEKPTLEELRCCVIKKKLRPTFKEVWNEFPEVFPLWNTITDCWDEDPDARLNMACVLSRLEDLYSTYNIFSQVKITT